MLTFKTTATAAINHLLRSEHWAVDRLRTHAGARIALDAGVLDLRLRIDEQGLLTEDTEQATPDVSIAVPPEAIRRFLVDRAGFFSAVRLSGSADIAESLAFVARNLRWDIEADLAERVGDIAARRLVMTGAHCARSMQNALRNLAENLREHATEESSLLPRPEDLQAFAQSVTTLRDDVARLEKRLARLG